MDKKEFLTRLETIKKSNKFNVNELLIPFRTILPEKFDVYKLEMADFFFKSVKNNPNYQNSLIKVDDWDDFFNLTILDFNFLYIEQKIKEKYQIEDFDLTKYELDSVLMTYEVVDRIYNKDSVEFLLTLYPKLFNHVELQQKLSEVLNVLRLNI